MLYFIPAWYQQNTWKENEQCWYRRRMHTEFDETVKQIQLFHRNGTRPYQIVLLSYTPNFRHFLHRQGVYHAPYWSCFDAIQEIRRTKMIPLSFHNLNWPEGTELVYTPYAVLAYLQRAKFAKVEFGEDGNPIRVDLFQNEQLVRRNIYDDRGFVSSTILYENQQMIYEDYLTEDGTWKMRHFADDHVEINPRCRNYRIAYKKWEFFYPFLKLRYETMGEVIFEVLQRYLRYASDKDIFCVAMHWQHTKVLQEVLKKKRTVLTFFEERFELKEDPVVVDMVRRASYIITDSLVNMEKVKQAYGRRIRKIRDITPYDSRVDFGITPQLKVRKILVPVDGLEDALFETVIREVAAYLPSNSYARVHLFTRAADFDKKQKILEKTRKVLQEYGFPVEWALEKAEGKAGGGREEQESIPVLFFVEQCVDELSISKCMREQRVIVDMRNQPELFLQIMAISLGIPQIMAAKTQYIESGLNGYIVSDTEEIGEQLRFYLDSLENWNSAVVGCYELGKQFTTDVLLNAWKEVLNRVGRG